MPMESTKSPSLLLMFNSECWENGHAMTLLTEAQSFKVSLTPSGLMPVLRWQEAACADVLGAMHDWMKAKWEHRKVQANGFQSGHGHSNGD